ncbi:electron transfer flavoprotein subunit alpha/FixB family protein [Acetobacter fallax]|uniref:Electron transfer flavoprotein subunit alpha/FixB family protein n=1 Tax=Acetobacter fallax TaxID=1737473 RepID=A0ABX0KE46_9PROT|nr:FAD-binding protein [Acetobacter fallax]NHO32222.1 electron transfer flavoprotein subunit alpha/FixB family protein [Acetobacter fallax]NHO35725.1 electron transfer flavoprotein subunit alpha/FixB family protein [Acetobacter fallax]
MTVLLLADHDHHTLSEATARALTAAKQTGNDIHILVTGSGVSAIAEAAATLEGISTVLVADDPALAANLAEPLAATILSLAGQYDTIAAAATSVGKDVLPRVAARLDVMQISDVIRVITPDTFERPIYAGNAIETVKTADPVRVLTIRTSAFNPAPAGEGMAEIKTIAVPQNTWRTRFEEETVTKSDRPELASAKIVISGGRALGSADRFRDVLGPLAERLHAAIGASRAAVDAGYAPNDLQVGQTGKVVAPDLYIALGISGAIQHLAGMKDSKIIVAINKDADAPIFQVADYGLVGDLFEVVPELEKALG